MQVEFRPLSESSKSIKQDTLPVNNVQLIYLNRTGDAKTINNRTVKIPLRAEFQSDKLRNTPRIVFSDRVKMHDNLGFAIVGNVGCGQKSSLTTTLITFIECGLMPKDISCVEKGYLDASGPQHATDVTYLGLYYGVSFAWVVTSRNEFIKYKIGTVNQELGSYKIVGQTEPVMDLIRFRGDFYLVDQKGIWPITLEEKSAIVVPESFLVKMNPKNDNQWSITLVQSSASHLSVTVVSNNSTKEYVRIVLEHCLEEDCDMEQYDEDPQLTHFVTTNVLGNHNRIRVKYVIKNKPSDRKPFDFSTKSSDYFIGYKDRLIIQGRDNLPVILLQSEIKQIQDLVYLNKSNTQKKIMQHISLQGVQKFPDTQNASFQGILPVGRNLEEDLHHLVVKPSETGENHAKLIKLNVEAPSLDCTLADASQLERASNLDMMVIYRADRLLMEQIFPLQYQVTFVKQLNWQHTLVVFCLSLVVLVTLMLQTRYCLQKMKEAKHPKEYFPQYNAIADYTITPEVS